MITPALNFETRATLETPSEGVKGVLIVNALQRFVDPTLSGDSEGGSSNVRVSRFNANALLSEILRKDYDVLVAMGSWLRHGFGAASVFAPSHTHKHPTHVPFNAPVEDLRASRTLGEEHRGGSHSGHVQVVLTPCKINNFS